MSLMGSGLALAPWAVSKVEIKIQKCFSFLAFDGVLEREVWWVVDFRIALKFGAMA